LRFVLYLKVNEVLFEVCIVSEGKRSIIWDLYCMWRKWSILINAACHIHCMIHFIWSFVVTYGPTVPVQLSIVRCPRRGTMRLHTLRGMKAEDICIEVIFVGIVDAGKSYTTYCGCSRKWDGIGYIGTTEFYIYKYFWS
jgi:hypothetical protein